MNANVTLNLYAATERLPDSSLLCFSSLYLNYAKSRIYHLPTGKVLRQSIAHYLINVDLFDYDINPNTEASLTFNSPSIVMVVMLNGHSIFYDNSKRVLKESHGNCCYLSYVAPGNYSREFLSGKHQVLLLTIPPGVIADHAWRFTEVQPVLDSYNSESKEYLSLANAPIAKGILRLLVKLNSHPDLNQKSFDKKVYHFLLECLDSYNKSLEQNSIQDKMQKEKADEIARFLLHNYSNAIVDSRSRLAAHFCISEATMLRLSKKRFGKSLHQHIIELRLLYGLKKLMTSNRSVKEVAISVGYADPYHFSRAFKQHFNICPSEINNLHVGR
jgi:AraC-like DNA-binding protein